MARGKAVRKLSESQLIEMTGRPITTQRGGISQRLIRGVVEFDAKGCYIEGNGQERKVLLRLHGYERVTIGEENYKLNYSP